MKAKEKYLRELKRLMYFKGKHEKRFISDLSNDIEEFLSSNKDVDEYQKLCSEFGSPLENFSGYLLDQNATYLYKRLRMKKIFVGVVVLICITTVVTLGISTYYYHKAYEESMEANIYGFTNEIEVIEEGE